MCHDQKMITYQYSGLITPPSVEIIMVNTRMCNDEIWRLCLLLFCAHAWNMDGVSDVQSIAIFVKRQKCCQGRASSMGELGTWGLEETIKSVIGAPKPKWI